jgi:hypothetical protein
VILRDSTNPYDIPLAGLDAVAGYADGRFAWSSAGWSRFPSGVVPLSIVVSATSMGDILDVEAFDATPADCPGWADRFARANRRRPTIYCNRAAIADVRAAMGSRPFDWWAATLDGQLHSDETSSAVAVQWKGAGQTGANYDESVIQDPSWIGRAGPRSMTGGAVAPGGEGTVILLKAPDGRTHRLLVGAGTPLADGTRGGPVHWIAIPGGAGGLDAWPGGDGELPGGGGWIAAGTLAAMFDLDTTGLRERLTVEGIGADGALWQYTVATDDYTVVEPWHIVAAPRVALPGAPAGTLGGGVPAHKHSASVAVGDATT